VADLLADCAPRFLLSADHLCSRRKIGEVWRNAEGVVLTYGGYRASSYLHSRTFRQTLLNGVAQSDVRVTRAFVFHIANAGETGFERDSSVVGAFERTESLRFRRQVQRVAVGAFRNARHEVCMAIDKTGKDGRAAKLDDFRVLGNVRLNLREMANFFDALACNPNSRVLDVSAFADIEQFSRFDQNGGKRRCLRSGTERTEPQKKRDGERSCIHRRTTYHNQRRVNKLAFRLAPGLLPRATMAALETTRGRDRSSRRRCRS